MKTFEITISTFFFVCLFNVAFIPQLCLDAVEELQQIEVKGEIVVEESTNSLNIFEEESKESSKENSEEENSNLSLKAIGQFRASIPNAIHESLVSNLLQMNLYQSVFLLKITPPPKFNLIDIYTLLN